MPVTAPQAVFGLYLLAVLGVGIYAAKFTEHRPADFYIADRTVGTLVLGLTLTATVLSSFTVFGIGAVTTGTGFGAYSYLGIAAIFYTFVFAVIGVALLKVGTDMDIVTPSEYIRKRYDSPLAGVIYLVATGIFMVGMIAGQLIGGGVALDALIGIPYAPAVIVMAAFMIVYMHIAGYRGVIWSDAIQSAVLFVVLAGVFSYAMFFLDSASMAAGAAEEVEGIFTIVGPLGIWTPLYIITAAVAFTFGVPFYPQSIQRYFSANTASTMRKSGFLFALIAIPMYFFAAGLGAWSLGVIPSPENADYVIPLVIETLTHPIVFGVAMAGAVSALMSTADSVALTMSSMISRDVYREFLNPEASEEQEVVVTQTMLILVIALAVVLAFIRPAGIFQLIAFAVVGFAATSPPVLLGLYWDRATAAGAVVSLVLGPAATIVGFLEIVPVEATLGVHYGFVGAVVAFVAFIVVSFATSAPTQSAIEDHSRPLWEEAD